MRDKKKILHLIHSGGLYGAENVVLNLSMALKKKGYESIVGCIIERKDKKPDVGIKAESLGLTTVYFKMNHRFSPTIVFKIANYYKSERIDILHSHGYKPSLICMILKFIYKSPYIITCHLWFVRNLKLRVYTFLERISMSFAQKVIGVSADINNSIKKSGVGKIKPILIDNGIDYEKYEKKSDLRIRELKQQFHISENSLIIGTLGRLSEQKDHKTLIWAASRILNQRNNIEFIVAGEGYLKNKLISLCRYLGIEDRFHFLGFRSDSDDILKLLDIFVLSSIDEGLPMAMLEAMATRLPVVATNVGAIPKIITNDETGQIVEKSNPKQLSNILFTLIDDELKRERLGIAACNIVKSKYSNKLMAEKYIDVYEKLFVSMKTCI